MPGRVRAHERALELLAPLDRDRDVGERAEAGRDAVGGLGRGRRAARRPRRSPPSPAAPRRRARPARRRGPPRRRRPSRVRCRSARSRVRTVIGTVMLRANDHRRSSLDGRSTGSPRPAGSWRSRAAARRRAMASAARERNAAAERLVRSLLERGELLYGVDHRRRLAALGAVGARGRGRPPVAAAAQPRRRRRRAADRRGRARGDGRARQPDRRGRRGRRRARCSTRCWARCDAGVTPFARELGSLGTGDLTVLAEIGVGARRRGRVLGRRRGRARRRGARRARARAGPLRPARRHRLHELQRRQHRPGRARLPRRDAGCWTPRSASPRSPTRRRAPTSRCSTRACTPRARTTARSRWRGGCASCSATEPRERAAGRAIHDAFVFRCVPQVEGTLLDALERLGGGARRSSSTSRARTR